MKIKQHLVTVSLAAILVVALGLIVFLLSGCTPQDSNPPKPSPAVVGVDPGQIACKTVSDKLTQGDGDGKFTDGEFDVLLARFEHSKYEDLRIQGKQVVTDFRTIQQVQHGQPDDTQTPRKGRINAAQLNYDWANFQNACRNHGVSVGNIS